MDKAIIASAIPWVVSSMIISSNSIPHMQIPVISYQIINNCGIEHNYASESSEIDGQKIFDRAQSMHTLHDIQKLDNNWDGYGAKSFLPEVISVARNIVMHMDEQPEIFPTGRNSIQMQYELADRSYLEFEVFMDKIEMLLVPQREYSRAITKTIKDGNVQEINGIVNQFYGA